MKTRYTTILKISAVALACGLVSTFSAHAQTRVWDAGVNATWDTATANWTGSTYANGNDVQFLDAGAGTVTTFGTISPGSILVDSSATYTIVGAISGGGSLIKNGTGQLNLSSNNSFTGGVTVNEGTLGLENGAIGANGPLTVNGGYVNVSAHDSYDNLAVSSLSGTGGLIAVGRRTFTINQSTDTTYAGNIQNENGVGGNSPTLVVKSGTGTLRLTGYNFYTQRTDINGGTLLVDGELYSGGSQWYSDVNVNNLATLGGSGKVLGDSVNVNSGGTLRPTAGEEFLVGGTLNVNAGATVDFNGGTLTATGQVNWNDGSTVTVGNGSQLNLGNATHTFTDGLTIQADGTLGTGNNSATPATIDNSGVAAIFTLTSGATIDYSIRGTDSTSDTWNFVSNLDANFGTAPTTLNLVVDVVAGDVKQTAGPFAIFDFGASVPTDWDSIGWTITAAPGTRISTYGSVIVGDGLNGLDVGQIGLSGFEAFSIPEPSTAMLLGLGAMVMILRRRIRR